MVARGWSNSTLALGGVALGLLCGCPAEAPPGNGSGTEPGKPAEKTRHEEFFTEVIPGGFAGPASCLICHENIAQDLLRTGHWNWQGRSVNISGHEGETHGPRDLLNNTFIGVPSNEGRCAQCHVSFGWKDKSFDFRSTGAVDCFVCHDTTGTYAKQPSANGGGGVAAVWRDGVLVTATAADLTPVVYHVGTPTRANCGSCHFYADGGDGVKRGDMSSALAQPTRDVDVHMGGQDFACQRCHSFDGHGIAGFTLHSVAEGGESPACTRCHGDTNVHRRYPPLDDLLNPHLKRLACEVCHIPTFARTRPTVVGWYWDTAGQDIDPVPTDALGQPTYDKEKGTLVWAQNVQPTYRWFNGQWRRKIIGVSDTYTEDGTPEAPVVLAEPVGEANDPAARIYPFKMLAGRQPADADARRLLVPHLFGAAAGSRAYWEKFDWNGALAEGAAYSGQTYSGRHVFVNTVMYLQLSHEVPPMEQALLCGACHGQPWSWDALGLADPLVTHR